MSQSKTATAKARVSPASGKRQVPPLSAYKRDKIVKTRHEDRRVEDKPCRNGRSPFCKETIASLYKRKSFTKSSKEMHKSLLKQRPESLDAEVGRKTCSTACCTKSGDAVSTMTRRETVDAALLQSYAFDAKNNQPSDAPNPNATQITRHLLQLRDDVECAYKILSDALKIKEAESATAAGNDGVLHRSKSSSLVDFESILDEILRENSSATWSSANTQSIFFRTASFPGKLEVSPSLESTDAAHEQSRSNSERTMVTQASEEERVGEDESDESLQSAEPRCQCEAIGCCCGASVPHGSDSQIRNPVLEGHQIYLPGNSRQPNVRGNLALAGISLVVGVIVGHVFSRGEN